jgi:hypothetical protein
MDQRGEKNPDRQKKNPDRVMEFFIAVILPTQPLTEMSTRNIFGGKGSRCLGLTTLSSSCADCLEIWEPRPPENLRDYYTFCRYSLIILFHAILSELLIALFIKNN